MMLWSQWKYENCDVDGEDHDDDKIDLEGLNLLLTDSFPRRLSAWSITSSCSRLDIMMMMMMILMMVMVMVTMISFIVTMVLIMIIVTLKTCWCATSRKSEQSDAAIPPPEYDQHRDDHRVDYDDCDNYRLLAWWWWWWWPGRRAYSGGGLLPLPSA